MGEIRQEAIPAYNGELEPILCPYPPSQNWGYLTIPAKTRQANAWGLKKGPNPVLYCIEASGVLLPSQKTFNLKCSHMIPTEILEQQPPEVRAEIESILRAAGGGAAGVSVLLTAGRRAAEMKSILREYLAYSSIDGRAEREPLRLKLQALLDQ
jgi:hypothetical protein